MGKHKPENVKGDDSRSSSSIHKTKRKHRERDSSSSDCSKSASDSDSSDHEKSSKKERRSTSADRKKLRKDKKRHKKKKKLEKKLKKEKKRLRKMSVDKPKEIKVPVALVPEKEPLSDSEEITERLLTHRAKAMAPMTKEEWDKRQSVVRRVYDEETGRNRLIKGDGEVIEEMVSRDRHVAINRQATQGDGNFFQASLAAKLRK